MENGFSEGQQGSGAFNYSAMPRKQFHTHPPGSFFLLPLPRCSEALRGVDIGVCLWLSIQYSLILNTLQVQHHSFETESCYIAQADFQTHHPSVSAIPDVEVRGTHKHIQ